MPQKTKKPNVPLIKSDEAFGKQEVATLHAVPWKAKKNMQGLCRHKAQTQSLRVRNNSKRILSPIAHTSGSVKQMQEAVLWFDSIPPASCRRRRPSASCGSLLLRHGVRKRPGPNNRVDDAQSQRVIRSDEPVLSLANVSVNHLLRHIRPIDEEFVGLRLQLLAAIELFFELVESSRLSSSS